MSVSEFVVVDEENIPLQGWNDPSRGELLWRTLFSSDSTPTDSMTIGTGELQPGERAELVLHSHTQPEIYYILSGHGLMKISGQQIEVYPGRAVFIPGNAQHSIKNIEDQLLKFLYVFPVDSYQAVDYHFWSSSNEV